MGWRLRFQQFRSSAANKGGGKQSVNEQDNGDDSSKQGDKAVHATGNILTRDNIGRLIGVGLVILLFIFVGFYLTRSIRQGGAEGGVRNEGRAVGSGDSARDLLSVNDDDYSRAAKASEFVFDFNVACYYFATIPPEDCALLDDVRRRSFLDDYYRLNAADKLSARNLYQDFLLGDNSASDGQSGEFVERGDGLFSIQNQQGGGVAVGQGTDSDDAASTSSISFEVSAGESSGSASGSGSSDEVRVVDSSDDPYSVQNAQGQKTEFTNEQQNDFQFTNPNIALAPLAPGRTVRTGQVIPITLRTGINSDLPGAALARVSSNVYSYDGRNVLIPAGSDVYGVYDSKVSFNQKRLLIAWNRIVRPDGVSLAIRGQPGTDLEGQIGFEDKVDYHFDELLSYSALLTGYAIALEGIEELFDLIPNIGGAASVAGNSDNTRSDNFETVLQSYGRVFESLADRQLNRAPTITIRPGWRGNILIQRDLIFPIYRD